MWTVFIVLDRSTASNLRGRIGVYVGAGSAMLALVASLAIYGAGPGVADSPINSFGDALWRSATTMTTVGFGDTYPVTSSGRWVAVGLMISGIVLLGTVTATLASWLMDAVAEESAEADDAQAATNAALHAKLDELRGEIVELRDLVGSCDAERSR